MTMTEHLRAMLDERGVEWLDSSDENVLHTTWNDMNCWFNEFPDGWTAWGMAMRGTPEQAIEATLGRGTCRDVRSTDHTIAFECSECGCWVAYDEYWETGIYVLHETGQEHIHPRYCPNCGRRIEQ